MTNWGLVGIWRNVSVGLLDKLNKNSGVLKIKVLIIRGLFRS